MKLEKYTKIFLLIGGLLCTFPSTAQTVSLATFIDEMVTRHEFQKEELTRLFKKAKVRRSILKLMDRPGEGKPWHQYRPRFVNEQRINGGVDFWQAHATTLSRAESVYGVPPEIIVAIIGVETIYGKDTGNVPVLDALTTLAFHYPRRADYFRGELEQFLLLTRAEEINPLHPKGSYAGAMGIGQFMPSSYRQHAVDFDRDGKRNIWTDVEDAIGSVANYFKQYGWQAGQPIIFPTQVRPDAINSLLTLELAPIYTLRQLKQKGLLFNGNQLENAKVTFIDLETEHGTAYWIGFENFYVITRYNHSKHYAMAVYQLAQEIADRYNTQNR